MAYEPTNWKTGDVVTSAKLNHMEEGIENAGGLIVTLNPEGPALDHTFREILDAVKAGKPVYYLSPASENNESGYYALSSIYNPTEGTDYVNVRFGGEVFVLYPDDETGIDDYPVPSGD